MKLHKCHGCGEQFPCIREACYLAEDESFLLCAKCYVGSAGNHGLAQQPAAAGESVEAAKQAWLTICDFWADGMSDEDLDATAVDVIARVAAAAREAAAQRVNDLDPWLYDDEKSDCVRRSDVLAAIRAGQPQGDGGEGK